MHPFLVRSCLVLSFSLIAVLLIPTPQVLALEDFSLNSKLSLSATPMPCSLTDEIKTDTPCDKTFLKWEIKSTIDLDLKIGQTDYFLDSALSISHPEHLVLGLKTEVGGLTLKPEAWFAVPFEGVTDVNNMYNSAVIPPGNPLFAAMRLTTSFSLSKIRFKNLFMYEDVNFPNPRSSFENLEYDAQSQSFKVGDIFYFSGRTESGIFYSSRTSFCAFGSMSVKNYSASGGVDPDCENGISERFSISGLKIGNLRLSETINLDLKEDLKVASRTGLNFAVFDWARLSTSLMANIIPFDIDMSGFSVGFTVDPFKFNVSFREIEEPKFNAATASVHQSFSLGMINGSFSTNATVQNEVGLSSVSMALFVSQGTISSSHSLSFSRRDGDFRFSYLNNRINLRLSPFTFSASPVFGENGLTRLAMSMGVMF